MMTTEEQISKEHPQDILLDASRLTWFDKKRFSNMPALLVGVYKGGSDTRLQCLEYLQELRLLCDTHEIQTVDQIALSMRTYSSANFLSTGKLEEVRRTMDALGAKLVVFDDEITPAQQRNLESVLRVPVIDRAEVILCVFADRAKTKEAKLQVELAQVKYIAPRLKRMWTHLSRQSGGGGGSSGGGYLKGVGEKQIEIDRRLLKNKIDRLNQLIREVKNSRATQRSLRERSEIPVFAIVGYTNAGKSTLMKQLTLADVFIEDKLFATLDTTTRKFQLPGNKQELLLIDTVGFIRKLPHLLVMAFRSTLEEAVQTDVLIHVIDASHPMALEQAATTLEVLKELHAGDKPVITVLNKMDRLKSDEVTPQQNEVYQKLRLAYPRVIEVSAVAGEGMDALFEEIKYVLQKRRHIVNLRIPQSEYQMVSEAIRQGKIISQEYIDNDVLIEVDLPVTVAYRFDAYKV
ncbi:MAG: hflX [Chlamydiia bacterium]|nr:hflX [Chlamydiia bacterium]